MTGGFVTITDTGTAAPAGGEDKTNQLPRRQRAGNARTDPSIP